MGGTPFTKKYGPVFDQVKGRDGSLFPRFAAIVRKRHMEHPLKGVEYL
jgi:hypothetical protein